MDVTESYANSLNLTQEEPIYCICRSPSSGFMIECSFCKEWYHGGCIGVTKSDSKFIDLYCCKPCKRKDPVLRTTYKEIYNKRQIKETKRKYKNSTISKNFERVSDLLLNHDYATLNALKISTVLTSDAETDEYRKYDFLEVSPQQLNNTLTAADELNCKKLADIHVKFHSVEKQLEELDIKIVKLIDLIRESKNTENYFVELQCDNDATLVSLETPNTLAESRLQQLFMKLEKEDRTDSKVRPKDDKWNIFCNRKTSKNSWCRKMKTLCPLHYDNIRKVGEVCGYNLGEVKGIVRYCGNKDYTCNHSNWEELERAELDYRKLVLFLKFKALQKEEIKLQKMSGCGIDVDRLMFKYIFEN